MSEFGFNPTSSGLYTVLGHELAHVPDEWFMMGLRLGHVGYRSPFRLEQREVVIVRDANATAGTWWQVITLAHRGVVWDGAEIYAFEPELHDMPGEYVPLFEGDPERAVWRRRKWWGRGPIVFSPWGRAVALMGEDVLRVSGIFAPVTWGPELFSPLRRRHGL